MTITFSQLQHQFEKPINEAALILGVGVTKLKSVCRGFNIKRWPFRKVQSLHQRLKELQVKKESGKCVDLESVQREYDRVQHALHTLLAGEPEMVLQVIEQNSKDTQHKRKLPVPASHLPPKKKLKIVAATAQHSSASAIPSTTFHSTMIQPTIPFIPFETLAEAFPETPETSTIV